MIVNECTLGSIMVYHDSAKRKALQFITLVKTDASAPINQNRHVNANKSLKFITLTKAGESAQINR